MNRETLIGKTFGRWVAIAIALGTDRGVTCRCVCKTVRTVDARTLLDGRSTSCGCFRGEVLASRNHRHGGARTKEYRSWRHLHERCENPNDAKYPTYGGRGIRVCQRWSGPAGFANFLADVSEAPSPRHSIERVNTNGDYTPDNCRWALPVEQGNNTRRNVFVVYEGVRTTVSQLARRLSVNRRHLAKLLQQGTPLAEALRRVSQRTATNYVLQEPSP